MQPVFAFLAEAVCLPETSCIQNSAKIISKSLLGEVASYTEIWTIHSDLYKFIVLNFEHFDVSCQSRSLVDIATFGTQQLCNANKPIHGIKSDDRTMVVKFTFVKESAFLIEGFKATYRLHSKQKPASGLVTDESSGKVVNVLPFRRFTISTYLFFFIVLLQCINKIE